MATLDQTLRSHRSFLKVLCWALAIITVVLYAWAYSRQAHQSNIGRGPFDATTEGSGPVENP